MSLSLIELSTISTIDTANVARELKMLISETLDLNLDFSVSVDDKNQLVVKSNDFADESFPRMFETLHLENFGSFYRKPLNENGAIEVTDMAHTWRLTLSYRYKNFSKGTKGTNGAEFATIIFLSDGSILECSLVSEQED